MLHLCHSPMSRRLILDSPETLDESAETSVDDRENTIEPVPIHTGNGDQSTKSLLQNLAILG